MQQPGEMTTNPRYQRAVQKIMRMSPHQKAILSTVAADTQFASEGMRKALAGMQMAATKADRERMLNLRETAMRTGFATRESERDHDKEQRRIGEMLGVGNLALSTHYGRESEKIAAMKEKMILDLMKKKGGIG